MNDAAIIALYWARDERAIEETVRCYGGFCYQIAYNILSVREDAEECVSDSYHKVWQTIPPERPLAFRPWLGRIVRNCSLSRWRLLHAKKRDIGAQVLLSELSACVPSGETIEQAADGHALTALLNDWLGGLSVEDRALFLRRYWNGDAVQDIARAWGVRPNKLSKRLHSLRKKLKIRLEEEGLAL